MAEVLAALAAPVVLALGLAWRVALWQAGLLAACVALVAGLVTPGAMALGPVLARVAWVAPPVVLLVTSVMAGGLLFHTALTARSPVRPPQTGALRLPVSALVVVLGAFVEIVTGFGVGAVIVFAALARQGMAPLPAAALCVFSQCLVAWGAMGVGTALGAALLDQPLEALTAATALASAALLLAFAAALMVVAAQLRVPLPLSQGLWPGLLALALVVIGLWTRAGFLATGLLASGGVLALAVLAGAGPGLRHRAGPLWRQTWPYLLVVGGVALAPVLARWVDPGATGAASWVLRQPAMWLILASAAVLALQPAAAAQDPRRAGALVGQVLRRWWPAARMTVVFVGFAYLYAGLGHAAVLLGALQALAGAEAAAGLLVALSAGTAFLTASNTGANALVVPLTQAMDLPPAAAAAQVGLQNGAGAAWTAVSPTRLAMVAALAGGAATVPMLYRALRPLLLALALATLAILMVAALMAGRVTG